MVCSNDFAWQSDPKMAAMVDCICYNIHLQLSNWIVFGNITNYYSGDAL